MARFRFTLQPLLDLRERVEDDRRREVAELERARLDLQRALDAARSSEVDERSEWRAMLGASRAIDLAGARRQAFAIAGMVQQARALELRLTKAQRAVEAARERLAHAAKERRAMELLRDQRRAEWERAQARAEAAMLDDLSMTRQVRGRLGESRGGSEMVGGGTTGEEAA